MHAGRRCGRAPVLTLVSAAGMLLVGSCGNDRPDVGSRGTGSPAPDARARAALDAASPCPALIQRWEAALAAVSLDCTRDADCGCFNGGVSERAGCGGVAAAASVATLETIRSDFLASCDVVLQCGPWACEPRCDEGRCVR